MALSASYGVAKHSLAQLSKHRTTDHSKDPDGALFLDQEEKHSQLFAVECCQRMHAVRKINS